MCALGPLPVPSGRTHSILWGHLLQAAGVVRGPLEPCYTVLDLLPFFHDCLDDVCHQLSARCTVCGALAAYKVACQALGVSLQPWAMSDFCHEYVGIGRDKA